MKDTERDVEPENERENLQGVGQEPRLFGRRHGWSVGRRLREPDSYGLLLGLIVATLLAVAIADRSIAGTTITLAFALATFLFALRTSLAPRAIQRAMLVLAPVVFLGTLASQAGSSRQAGVVTSVATALLVLGALVAVAHRLLEHPTISGATILGAVCAYLLLGLVFASVYALFGHLGRGFVQEPNASAIDSVYFSFVTLTTVGYGDLTPGGSLLRIIAVLEALMGQLYLVTVIAVLVANIGSTRRRGGSSSR